MRSTKAQLLLTALATLVTAGFFVHRGPPPQMTALYGISCGDAGQVRRGLAWGTLEDINGVPTDGGAPLLHYAVWRRSEEMVLALLDMGADINGRAPSDARLETLSGKSTRASGWIVWYTPVFGPSGRKGDQPLHWAAQMANVDMVRLLLQHGADPNGKGIFDHGPLMRVTHTAGLALSGAVDRVGPAPQPKATLTADERAIVKLLQSYGAK